MRECVAPNKDSVKGRIEIVIIVNTTAIHMTVATITIVIIVGKQTGSMGWGLTSPAYVELSRTSN